MNTILDQVQCPITYMGNEVNSVHKELTDSTIRFALAFPDVYELGMSHIGTKILYGLLNEQEDVWCERVFTPLQDMEELMVENGLPLYALESMDPVKNFDFIGFSLQYEMSYTNVLHMLSLAHIPVCSADRREYDPIIIAGGPCTYNPEPMADFIDIFIIGESEEVIPELLEVYRKWKESGQSREGFLLRAVELDGVYVPKFYNVAYNDDGTIKSFNPTVEQAKPIIKKRFVSDLDKIYYPDKNVVSYCQTAHDRLSYEIFRGCPHGCRFCQAGQIYKPLREKSMDTILKDIDQLLRATGYEEVSLASLSSADYSHIEELISKLMDRYEEQKIGIALPSTRADAVSVGILEQISRVNKPTLTIAPEAGTQRMRDIINKNVTEEDILSTVSMAFQKAWSKIKLYFMMGLPYETDADLVGIADLAEKVVQAFYDTPKNLRAKSVRVNLSASCFVPKPFTAFQWVGQVDQEEFNRRQDLLKNSLRNNKVKFSWHDSTTSYYEAILARGDRKLGKVVKKAWEMGCKFDSWKEHFHPEIWDRAFKECGVDPDFYALRERSYAEILPWDFIDIGVSKDYLIMEAQKAKVAKTSVNCQYGCEQCGVMEFAGVNNLQGSLCLNKPKKEDDKSKVTV